MLEKEFTCWYQGQTEADGKELKAPTFEAAAKKAVDIWRHEKIRELGADKVTVYVRDQGDRKVDKIIISAGGSRNAPEAFTP